MCTRTEAVRCLALLLTLTMVASMVASAAGSSGKGKKGPAHPNKRRQRRSNTDEVGGPAVKLGDPGKPKGSGKTIPGSVKMGTVRTHPSQHQATRDLTPEEKEEENDRSLRVVPIDKNLKTMYCGGIYAFELVPEGFPSYEHLMGGFVEVSQNYGTILLDHMPRSTRPNITSTQAIHESPRDETQKMKFMMNRKFDDTMLIPFEQLVMEGPTQSQPNAGSPTLSRVVRVALHNCNLIPWSTIGNLYPYPIDFRLSFKIHFPTMRRGSSEVSMVEGVHTLQSPLVKVVGLELEGVWLPQIDHENLEQISAFHQFTNSAPAAAGLAAGIHDSGMHHHAVHSSGARMQHELPDYLKLRVRAFVGPYVTYVENGGTEFEMPPMPPKKTTGEVAKLKSKLCSKHLPSQDGPEKMAMLDLIEREVQAIQSDTNNAAYATAHFTNRMLTELFSDFCIQGVRDKIGTWSPAWYFVTLDEKIMQRGRYLFSNIRVRCDPAHEWCPREDDSSANKDLPVVYTGNQVTLDVTIVELGPVYHSEAVHLKVNLTSRRTRKQIDNVVATRTAFGPHPSIPGGWESHYSVQANFEIHGFGVGGGSEGEEERDVFLAHFELKLPTVGYKKHLNHPLMYIDNEGDNILRTSLQEAVADSGKRYPTGTIIARSPPKEPPSPLVFGVKRSCSDETQCSMVWMPRPVTLPGADKSTKVEGPTPPGTGDGNSMLDPKTGFWVDRCPRLFSGNEHVFEVNVTEYFPDLPHAPKEVFPLEVELPIGFNYSIRPLKRVFVSHRTVRQTFNVHLLTPDTLDDNSFIGGSYMIFKGTTRGASKGAVALPNQKKPKKLSLRFPIAIQNTPVVILAWVVDGVLMIEAKLDLQQGTTGDAYRVTRKNVQHTDWSAKHLPVDAMVKNLGIWLKVTAKRPPVPGQVTTSGSAPTPSSSERIVIKPALSLASSGCKKVCEFKAERCSKRVDLECQGLTHHTPIRLHFPLTHPRLKKPEGSSTTKQTDSGDFAPLKGNLTEADALTDFRLEFGIGAKNVKSVIATINNMRLNWFNSASGDDSGNGASHESGGDSSFSQHNAMPNVATSGGGRSWIRAKEDREMVTYVLPTNTTGTRGRFEEQSSWFKGSDWNAAASGTTSDSNQVTGGFLMTTNAILLVILPIALAAVLLAGISARSAPSLNPKDWVALQRPLLEHRTFWSYFWSQHLWLGVLHPCRPQCREHHTYVLAFVVSYHGLLAACTNPEEIFAGVITSLVTTLLCRYAVEQMLLRGDPIPMPSNSAARAHFRKMASKSAVLGAAAVEGILPPMPKFMLSPNMTMVVACICACNVLTKFVLDTSLVGDICKETYDLSENSRMNAWWHQFLVALILDGIVVQSILSACTVFVQSVPIAGYPRNAASAGSAEDEADRPLTPTTTPPSSVMEAAAASSSWGAGIVSAYQTAQAFLNMELSHPLILGEEPPYALPVEEGINPVGGSVLSVLFGVGTLQVLQGRRGVSPTPSSTGPPPGETKKRR